jgi:uncharacterized repeat protein (TIGR02543 family)
MLDSYVKKAGLLLTLALTAIAVGSSQVQAGPGTYATEAAASPSGGTFYANSPSGLWSYTDAFGATRTSNSGTALRKFVDSLPGLGSDGCSVGNPVGTGTCHENNLGNYIPIANPKNPPVTWGITGRNAPASDYYEIDTVEYTQKLHSDLPKATNLRGYKDSGATSPAARYLGPVILATKDKPVRLKFKNSLTTDLPLPVDTTYMGAGYGPPLKIADGLPCTADEEAADPTHAVCRRYPYSQKRTAVHLHGGHTPWISDGTPFQWFTPANDPNLPPLDPQHIYSRGASFQNVPDMCFDNSFAAVACDGPNPTNTDPGPGYQTLYYTNQQSPRMMFYHDHAFGTTRLNVYAGIAAGYLIVDPVVEGDMIDNTKVLPNQLGIPEYRYGIPLVIQEKIFVPSDITVQDAKWSKIPKMHNGTTVPDVNIGGYGDLWFPHVYETNQDPYTNELSGANNFGRWDYGPWFWPPVPIDLTRTSPYAPLPVPKWDITSTPEAFADTPLVNGTAYPYLNVTPEPFRFRILNAANDRPLNLQLYVADPAGYAINAAGNPVIPPVPGFGTEIAMVSSNPRPDCTYANAPATPTTPSTCTCAQFSPAGCFPPTWPTDGRVGGVPDPQYAGPKFVQIGTESGWLPNPVVIDNQPVSFDYNRRNIVVLDILDKSLLLGPAERADVIVDFSAFAGKTIILYTDAPTPMPAFDTRYDYYTGDPDQLAFGGAAPTKPGYGPNTRTIMQFRVGAVGNANTNSTPLYNDAAGKLAALNTALTAAFNGGDKPIIPETTNSSSLTNVYGSIFDTSLTFTPVGSSTTMKVGTKPKAIQELWDNYGRMNATLGVELPFTNNVIQTTIPLGYNDPVTETINDGEIQIWKITHNGVDTHPVHFHLTDVQVINRVGWDGAIRPPDLNEVGWKETVRMKPLEDIFVALRPKLPSLPFDLPTSQRLHDPTEPPGATLVMTSPVNGNPVTGAAALNQLEDFGHEFVWHCHILGHEENDFMRPIVFTVPTTAPAAPILQDPPTVVLNTVILTWTDPNSIAPNIPSSFLVQRSLGGAGVFDTIATVANLVVPNTNTYTYTDTDSLLLAGTTYDYRIVPVNSVNSATPLANPAIFSNTVSALMPAALVTVEITAPLNGSKYIAPASIDITATVNTTDTGATVDRVDLFVNDNRIQTILGAGPYAYTWPEAPASLTPYSLTAKAYSNLTLLATSTATVNITVEGLTPTLISPAIAVTNTAFYYTWNEVPGATSYDLSVVAGSTAGTTADVAGIPANNIFYCNNGICSYQHQAPPLPAMNTLSTYTWTVRANDNTAVVQNGPWAPGNTFTVGGTPTDTTSPDFQSRAILLPDSQLPFFQNIIPNALADYFTYVPYTTADAVKLGFPGTCGNLAKGDAGSSEDCYTITAKRFDQQLALPGIFGGGQGLKDQYGNYFASFTNVFGYGSGGSNWTPPGGVPVTGNAPVPFADGTLSTSGIWHFPAPTVKATKGRKVRIQWLNELPNQIIPGHDPTIDCGTNAPNCYPYNRIVTHVHGAHVGPESDGWTKSWFTDLATNVTGDDWQSTAGANGSPFNYGPEHTYLYPVDQDASTIWYHDHAIGTTHLNTNMGLAGFFLSTDSNEKLLQGATGGTKYLPTGDFELGFALQDRNFYTNGQLAMPDVPVIDATKMSCTYTYVNGDIVPDVPVTNCAPLFMKDPVNNNLIPWDTVDPAKALLATSASLEYVGNMPVVNGVPYGSYNVEPRVYRMRFIGGTDSRTWIMQLKNRTTDTVIPFWQIGTEQGFLNNPVQRTSMVLMPGERVDVLVDFKNVSPGSQVVMNNLGPDEPYNASGTQAASAVIPEIMQFNVGSLSSAADVPSPDARLNLRPVDIAALTPTTDIPVRKVSLAEILDSYGRTTPTIDGRGFMMTPLGLPMPVTEVVGLGHTEIWEIVNTTVDAHPMHLHQVAFQLINREPVQANCGGSQVPPLCVTPAGTSAPFTPISYVGTGVTTGPAEFEAGWKDTIVVPPGAITRIIAKFDIAGQYVWHCHILSHEEHDMMRPLLVATAAEKPATLAVPPSAIQGATVTVDATATPSAGTFNYVFEYKKTSDTNWTEFYSGALLSATTPALSSAGMYSFRVKAVDSNFGTATPPTYANSPYTYGDENLSVGSTYSITVIQSAGGTITPAGTGGNVHVAPGGTPTFTITPTGINTIVDVLVDEASVLAQVVTGTYTFPPVNANHTIRAVFFTTFTLTFVPGNNGTLTGGTPNVVQTVNYNTSATAVTAVPNLGYRFVNWTGTNGFVTTGANPITVANVSADQTITANFAIDTFTITTSVTGGNGTISPTPTATVDYGGSQAVTVTPNANYHIASVTVDGGTPITSFTDPKAYTVTFTNVTASHTVVATFAIDTFTITTNAGANGSITPTATVNYGSNQTVTVTPAANYHIASVLVDGVAQTVASPDVPFDVVFNAVSANHAVIATFAINTNTITTSVTGGNGTISPTPTVTVDYGASQAVTVTPNANYHIASVTVDGGTPITSFTDPKAYTVTFTNVTASHTVVATFAIDTFTITTNAGANGSITPTATVNYGSNQTVTVTPAANYHIASVLVDGVAQTVASPGVPFDVVFNAVSANHTVIASFTIDTFTVNFAVNVFGTGYLGGNPSQIVNYGGTASMIAVPAPGYFLLNWTDGNGIVATTDTITLNNVTANRSITANFAPITPFKLGSKYYSTLQAAYDAAITGDTIQIGTGAQNGTLLANRPVDVIISGGWDVLFFTHTGTTTIQSFFVISNGTVRVSGVKIVP